MKTVVLLVNAVLLVFTCLVLTTDGAPQGTPYVVFTILLIFIPIFTIVVIVRNESTNKWSIAAAILNSVLFAFVCWALVDQYPHPPEAGVVEFEVLVLLTPIINAVFLLRGRPHRPGQILKSAGHAR